METIIFYVLYPMGIWAAKKGADALVKASKKTEKTKIDDFLAEGFQVLVNIVSGRIKKK